MECLIMPYESSVYQFNQFFPTFFNNKLTSATSIIKGYLSSYYYAFIVFGISLELKGLAKNYELIKLRFRKVKLNRKMPGILDRIKPRTILQKMEVV